MEGNHKQAPQETVLAPDVIAVYVNDVGEAVDSYINVFVNDDKLLRRAQKEDEDSL